MKEFHFPIKVTDNLCEAPVEQYYVTHIVKIDEHTSDTTILGHIQGTYSIIYAIY